MRIAMSTFNLMKTWLHCIYFVVDQRSFKNGLLGTSEPQPRNMVKVSKPEESEKWKSSVLTSP